MVFRQDNRAVFPKENGPITFVALSERLARLFKEYISPPMHSTQKSGKSYH